MQIHTAGIRIHHASQISMPRDQLIHAVELTRIDFHFLAKMEHEVVAGTRLTISDPLIAALIL